MGGALIAVGAVVIVGACVLLWSRPSNDTDIGAELLFVVGIGVFALDVARIDRTLFLVGRALTAIGAVLIVVASCWPSRDALTTPISALD